jgi:catechol-2,3-dioxygenase
MATAVWALGEVALRVNDLYKSQAFYADVIGLELMRRFEHAAFFRIADGYSVGTRPCWRSSRAKPPSSRRTARSTIWRSPSRLRTMRPRSGGWKR